MIKADGTGFVHCTRNRGRRSLRVSRCRLAPRRQHEHALLDAQERAWYGPKEDADACSEGHEKRERKGKRLRSNSLWELELLSMCGEILRY